MSFSCQKGEFDQFFNRLGRPVEESRPDRQPDWPADPTGAGRPDRFPSLLHVLHVLQYCMFTFFIGIAMPSSELNSIRTST